MTLEDLRNLLQIIYYIAAIIGIPVGITVFLIEKRRERLNREIDVYLQSFDRYIVYLKQILDHPDIGCGEFHGDEENLKSSGFTVQQITLYQLLMMTMEQTYFLYKTSRLTRKNNYWNIWTEYIAWWASREDFQRAWNVIDPWLDPGLKVLINSEIQKTINKKAQQKHPAESQ